MRPDRISDNASTAEKIDYLIRMFDWVANTLEKFEPLLAKYERATMFIPGRKVKG